MKLIRFSSLGVPIRNNGGVKELNNQRGSSTLEASLVFPAIFLTLLLFILLSLVVYQKVTSYYTSAQSTQRISYVWDNSHKNIIDGDFPFHLHDSLYWRLTDDQFLGFVLNRNSNAQAILSTNEAYGNSLIERKLSRIVAYYPDSMRGIFHYRNGLLERKVQVTTENPIQTPILLRKWFGNTLVSSTEARVTDPVEFIRTLDLVRYYKDRIQDGSRMNQILDQQKEKGSK